MQNFFYSEGNAGSNFELKTIPGQDGNEYRVLNFSLRCPVESKTDNGYEDTGGFWVNIEYWGARAEMTHKLLKKGVRLVVVGTMSTDSFVASKGEHVGETITVTRVKADNISFSPLGIENIAYATKASPENETAENTPTNAQVAQPQSPVAPETNAN